MTDTNVALNIAISPSLWLLPSNLILLNKPIQGYNNKLKVSNENMKFGLNNDINRVPIKELQMDTLGDENPKRNTKRQYSKKNQKKKRPLIPLFTVSGIITYLIKYII